MTEADLAETQAYRAAIEAFVTTFASGLRGASAEDLFNTAHDHVGVVALSDGRGLKFSVTIKFDEVLSASKLQALASLGRRPT